MFRAVFAFTIVTAAVAQTAAQTASPDTQALQALVTEIRQLRQDLQVTTIATQRVQIVLYRVQTQTAMVTAAAARLEDARTSLGKAQSELKRVSGIIPMMEEEVRSAPDAAQRKSREDSLIQTKINIERSVADEQRLQSREIDAETQYRAEQAKLADLQDQLDRLDKLLDSLSRKQP
jgi:valyl-tRNA synthetase